MDLGEENYMVTFFFLGCHYSAADSPCLCALSSVRGSHEMGNGMCNPRSNFSSMLDVICLFVAESLATLTAKVSPPKASQVYSSTVHFPGFMLSSQHSFSLDKEQECRSAKSSHSVFCWPLPCSSLHIEQKEPSRDRYLPPP